MKVLQGDVLTVKIEALAHFEERVTGVEKRLA